MIIYMVEDNVNDIKYFRDYIKTLENVDIFLPDAVEDYEAFLGQEGKYSANPKPDLLLLDIKLNNFDCFDILESVDNDDKLRKLYYKKVIIVTAHYGEQNYVKSFGDNLPYVTEFIKKPLTPVMIKSIIERFENVEYRQNQYNRDCGSKQ